MPSGQVRVETGGLTTRDGLELFTRQWLPKAPRSAVILSHGYAEHAGRYRVLAERLAQAGHAVYALDHRGHGRSQGEKANVKVFRSLVADLVGFVERVRETRPDPPRFIIGAGTGALAALQLALEHPHKVDGLVLSSPFIENRTDTPWFKAVFAKVLGRTVPSQPMQDFDVERLSRDPAALKAYREDPLVYHGPIKAGMGAALLEAGPYLLSRAESIQLPVLILQGTENRVSGLRGTERLYDLLGSENKKLIRYEGAYHDLFNDLDKKRVIADTLAWLDAYPS